MIEDALIFGENSVHPDLELPVADVFPQKVLEVCGVHAVVFVLRAEEVLNIIGFC